MLSSLKLNGLQLLGVQGYIVHKPVEGLEAPSVRSTAYDKPGEDGGVLAGLWWGQRAISITGQVEGTSSTEHETNRRSLQAACAVTRDTFGYPTLGLLEFTTLSGDQYEVEVGVVSFKNPMSELTVSDFMIGLLAPDHRLYKVGTLSSGGITRPAGGGALYPVIYPVTYGASSGGTASVNNTGNISVYPKLTLTGQLTNPHILNVTTGKLIQLNRTIAAGETVVIDMGNKTITLNGASSLLTTKTSDSVWWELVPGVNTINFNTGSSSDTGTLEVTWQNALIGI